MGIKDTITQVRNWFAYPNTTYYPFVTSPFEVVNSDTGVPFVSVGSALHFSPVYRAVTLISNDIARTPVEFESPMLETLWDRPNRYQSGYDFRRMLTLQVLLYGNSFALINRRRNGEIYELIPMPIGSVSLITSEPVPYYQTAEYGKIALEDMLHFKASPVDGLWASSPIQLCRTAIVIGLNQENNILKNAAMGGLPSLAFVHPGQMNAAGRQAMVNEYIKNHTGKNAGKPMVLSENVKIEKLTSTSVASDLEVARKYSISDVSRIYGVPTTYLSETSGNVYGSMEWLTRQYLDSCLSHWFECWKSEWFLKLGEEPLFDTDLIIKPPLAEMFAALRTGVESGIITKNEARAYMNFDPVEGGDDFVQAMNMGTGGGTTNIGDDTSNGNAPGDVT